MAKGKTKKQLRSKANRVRVAASNFLVLSFGLAWILAAALSLAEQGPSTYVGFGASIVILFVPALVVFLIYNKHLTQFLPLGLNPNWQYLWALVLPLALVALSAPASLLAEGVGWSWSMEGFWSAQAAPPQAGPMGMSPFVWLALQGLVSGLTLGAFFALGEELGWRGLLVKEWSSLGFWKASLGIGFFQGLWYAPLAWTGFRYPGEPEWGILLGLGLSLGLSPLLVWVRLRSNSIAAAALFMGLVNGTSGLSSLFLTGNTPLNGGFLGWPGVLVLLCANLLLWGLGRPRLGKT